MKFNIQEFLELEEDEILDWWTQNGLPHPGCPNSFKMTLNLVYMLHKLPEQFQQRKGLALKETLSWVHYHKPMRFSNEEPGKVYDQLMNVFYYPWKDKYLFVPVSNDYDYQTDYNLVRLLYQ